MSLHEYRVSQEIELEDYPFYALIFSAMRQADDKNIEKLKSVFPEQWNELFERYNSSGGIVADEKFEG